MKKIFFFLLLAYPFLAKAQDNSAYKKELFIVNKDTLPYRILYPLDYKQGNEYPLILFLHGAGERGRDNESQLVHGSKLFADEANRKKFHAIVIFPQCAENDFWARTKFMKDRTDSTPYVLEYPGDQPIGKSLNMVIQLLDSFAATGSVDAKRIYVGGLSMGGMGTLEILWRKPEFFAAAFPICGGGNTGKTSVYGKKFPIWVFHGADDPVVDVNDSRKMVAALKAAGAEVKYTEYPGVEHDSWNNAFAEKDLLPWLFDKKKK